MTQDGQRSTIRLSAILAGLGGLLLTIGSFMSWVTVRTVFGELSRSGVEDGGDGVVTLVLGILTIVVAAAWLSGSGKQPSWLIPVILGGVAGALALVDVKSVSDVADEFQTTAGEFGDASIGPGLVMVIIGAGVAIWAGFAERALQKHPDRTESPDPDPVL